MFERVCLSVYVCMPQTYIHKPNIHTQLIDLLIGKLFKRLSSVYVCLKTLCLSWKTASNIQNETYIHEKNSWIFIFSKAFRMRLFMYVCLKTLCLSWKMKHTRSNIHAQYTSRVCLISSKKIE